VFARSTSAYEDDPEPAAVEAATFAVTVLQPELAAAVPFPPQAATSKATATSRAALSVMRPFGPVFISSTSRV
jgi:hypothetical protein